MSGHSKWSKIKRQKGVKDQQRGAVFTKIGKNITLAAKEGGGDPDMNFSLRLAIDKAKEANMPANNIERAIKKGTGEGGGTTIQRITYEAFGINGVSIVIDCQTDNTNRSVAEVKRIVESNGGKFASVGSIIWKFDEKGLIILAPSKRQKSEKFGKEDTFIPVDMEELQMEIMEIDGVLDMKEEDALDGDDEIKALEIITTKNEFAAIVKEIQQLGYKIISADLAKLPKEVMSISEEAETKNNNLIELLEDHDDVDSVWTDY